MSASDEIIQQYQDRSEYDHGFVTNIDTIEVPKGLSEETIRFISKQKKEINKIIGKINRDGFTVVPTRIYFNSKGIAKVNIAIAKGKKQHDKRQTKKQRDWNREKSRVFRKLS